MFKVESVTGTVSQLVILKAISEVFPAVQGSLLFMTCRFNLWVNPGVLVIVGVSVTVEVMVGVLVGRGVFS
jgi:hypothetical protein